jgi:hypothetical protein
MAARGQMITETDLYDQHKNVFGDDLKTHEDLDKELRPRWGTIALKEMIDVMYNLQCKSYLDGYAKGAKTISNLSIRQ